MHPIVKINMLFASWEARIEKNCSRGLEIAARGRRSRAAFSKTDITFFYYMDRSFAGKYIFFLLSLSHPVLKSLVLIVDSHRA